MTPDRILVLRRPQLALACRTLLGDELRLLLALAHGACPATNRIWVTPLRIADDWDLSPEFVSRTLEVLVAAGHLRRVAESRGDLVAYEIGPLVFRHAAPPANLPVAPEP